jgi:hypothetical protein
MLWLFLVLLFVAAIFSMPSWPYSRGWGYYPSGGLGLIAVVVLALLVLRT